MQASDRAYALIRRFEALRLDSYRCPAGVWSVGYGHTREAGPDQHITEDQAEAYLRGDVAVLESLVSAAVTVAVSQEQFDALVSFAFNVGRGAFVTSTLLAKLNAGDAAGSAREFNRWIYAHVTKIAGQSPAKITLPGLVARREAERALFEGIAV